MKAIVLCAGIGKRAKPLTNHLPKPLLPFRGKPIIYYIIKDLKAKGINKILINLHWKGELIEEYLKKNLREIEFCFKHEKEILGTGGAIKNFENELIEDDYFLIHNGDTIVEFNLDELKLNLKNGAAGSLALKKKRNGFTEIGLKKDGTILLGKGDFNYSGVSLWRSDVLKFLPYGFSNLKEALLLNKKLKDKIKGLPFKGLWYEFNTPKAYLKNHFQHSNKEFYSGRNVFVSDKVKLKKSVLWEDVEIYGEGVIESSIVLSKINLKLDGEIKNKIIFKDKEKIKFSSLI